MTEGTCPICSAAFSYDETLRGRRRVHCSDACTNQAFRNRRSIAKQAARQAAALPCVQCGDPVAVSTLGPVSSTCSKFCAEVSRGQRLAEPLDEIACALPECERRFRPAARTTRCCSERHGKILWNRESRADGRQKPAPWGDQRRANWQKRQALKKGASTAETFLYADVFERDEWTCGICCAPVDRTLEWPDPMSKSLDHILPLSKGGSHTADNAQCAHLVCNVRKGDSVAV